MNTRISFGFQTSGMANYYANTSHNALELRMQLAKESDNVQFSVAEDIENHYLQTIFNSPEEWHNFVKAVVAIDYSLGEYLNEEEAD